MNAQQFIQFSKLVQTLVQKDQFNHMIKSNPQFRETYQAAKIAASTLQRLNQYNLTTEEWNHVLSFDLTK